MIKTQTKNTSKSNEIPTAETNSIDKKLNLVNNSEKNKLIQDHMTFAKRIAQKYYNKMSFCSFQLEDFISESYIGLIKAASNFNGKVSFKHYASIRITGHLLDCIRKEMPLSRRTYNKVKKIKTSEKRQDLINQMSLLNDTRFFLTQYQNIQHVDINECLHLVSPNFSPEEQIIHKNLQFQILKKLKTCFKLEHVDIFEDYYFNYINQENVAFKYKVSFSRISQILKKMVSYLKSNPI